jgi:hypothetical protein
MADMANLKQALRGAIDAAGADGKYSEAAIDHVHALIDALAALTPLPRPIDAQDKVAGPWGTLLAQFGPRHTAGKPIAHLSSFKLLTFGSLPDRPLRMIGIEQEIHHISKDYNNLQIVESPDGTVRAHLIMFGKYHIEADTPKRYSVDFDRVVLRSSDGTSDDGLRAAFGFDMEQSLELTFKPPKLHSDIIFCDDEMRINFGSMGGVYVMERLHHGGHSVRFP